MRENLRECLFVCNTPSDSLIDLTQIDERLSRALRGATKQETQPQHSVAL